MEKSVFENLNLKMQEQIKIRLNDGNVIDAINLNSPAYRAAIEKPKREEHFYYLNLSNNNVSVVQLKDVLNIDRV